MASDGGPLYGLSANIALPPLAAMLSIAMLLCVDWAGLLVLRCQRLADFGRYPWLRWQAPVVGAAAFAALLYPAALFGGFPRSAAGILALGMSAVGFIRGWKMAMSVHGLLRRPRLAMPETLFWSVVVGLGLLALGPVTDADSLDYHVGVAISILNTGAFPFSPEWFTSRLAGGGEVLIALGLSIGAEQFGSLLQYSGVLGIAGIFRHGFAPANSAAHEVSRWQRTVALAAISSPVFLAWAASPKPMLLPVAMTTAALAIAVTILADARREAPAGQLIGAFSLVCLLVMAAAAQKMNFLMSGAVVGFVAFGYMVRSGRAVSAVIFGIAGAMLIMVPPLMWKQQHYGGALVDALLTPFPGHWPGTGEFEAMLRGHRDTNVSFPLSLVIPEGLGTITTVLGLGLLVPLASAAHFRLRDTNVMAIALAALVVAVLGTFLGQRNARFFLEPYLWLLMATTLVRAPTGERMKRWVSRIVTVQSVLVLAMIGIGAAMLTQGAMTPALRESTMERHAYGHSVMKWADGVLPAHARIVVEPRSVALAPRYAIANDWRGYVGSESNGAEIYAAAVASQRPEFTLVHLAAGERPALALGCADEAYAGPFRSRMATRNPFNSGAEYDAWIVRYRDPQASGCTQNRCRCVAGGGSPRRKNGK